MAPTLVALLLATAAQGPRFELAAPLPGLPPVMVDALSTGVGEAQVLARARGLQARILWVDGTANLERCSSAERVEALVARAKRAGFNTIVYDVKPISGQVLYPSKIAPKLTEWKGQRLPEEFDPLREMVRQTRAQGLLLFACLNAFSEGHQLFRVGPGYDRPDLQTVLYDPLITATVGGLEIPLAEAPNAKLPKDGAASYTDAAKVPVGDGVFTLTLDRAGRVVDGFERGGLGASVPTLPAGGGAIAASGEWAQKLRNAALVGQPVVFATRPRFRPAQERPDLQYPLMMNPHLEEVQARTLAIVEELLSSYEVDGLLYDDRLRFAGLNADFSAAAQEQFSRHVGQKVAFPEDIYEVTVNGPGLTRGLRPGRFFEAWTVWRAQTMKDWVQRVGETARRTRPGVRLGMYGGSWYGDYPSYGANYGGEQLEAGFWFLTPEYAKTGFASTLDLLITGCYYRRPTIFSAMEQAGPVGVTIEAAGTLTNRVADDQCWAVAGIQLSLFKGDQLGLERALQAACASTQGVMVFDLSHDIEPLWPVFERAFRQPARAPYARAAELKEVRARRRSLKAKGHRLPPVRILSGTAGTGF